MLGMSKDVQNLARGEPLAAKRCAEADHIPGQSAPQFRRSINIGGS